LNPNSEVEFLRGRSVSVLGHSYVEYTSVLKLSGVPNRKSVAAPEDGRTPTGARPRSHQRQFRNSG
jgi:hypothetical protein